MANKLNPLRLLLAPFAWMGSKFRQLWRGYRSLYVGAAWWQKLLLGVGSFVGFVLCYCIAVQFNFLWLFGKSPSLDDIRNPRNDMASEVYSADGKLLGRYFNENRQPVPYDSIAPVFFDALISTEDERFYEHHGVDFYALGSALKDAIRGKARGASTITQQLVKNMLRVRTKYGTGLLGKIPGVGMLIMKSKEMIIATELEWFCSKQEILTMYANTVDFGSNAYGIKTAAKTYFNTTPAQLKTEEAAVLVGLLKATSAYNPKTNPNDSKRRRNVVLENMVSHGKLNATACNELKTRDIELKFSVENPLDGIAPYFRHAVIDELKTIDEGLDPYRDGLKIYTTLDSRMQRYAEEATIQHMKQLQQNFKGEWGERAPWADSEGKEIPGFVDDKLKQTEAYKQLSARYPNEPDRVREILNTPHELELFDYNAPNHKRTATMSSVDSLKYMLRFMHAGFVAIEPQTGFVRAYVGDVDFSTWQHDKAAATHQPGSTFKLFTYATAIKQGWLPNDARLTDSYIKMDVVDKHGVKSTWTPKNANGNFSGAQLSLRTAFAKSINTIAVKLGQEVGTANVIKTAEDMGITTPLEDAPSLPLGASDVKLTELIGAYAAVANNGEYVKPCMVTRIVDADGNEIYNHSAEARTVLTDKEAFYMQTLLAAGVGDGGGTSQGFAAAAHAGKWYWNGEIDLGGKTGTSNANADAWFVGVSPNLVAGAWVGGEYRQIHFRSGRLGQGAKAALPIVGLFFNKVLSDAKLSTSYLAKFNIPAGVDANELTARYQPTETTSRSDSTQTDSTATTADFDNDVPQDEDGRSLTDDGAPTTESKTPTTAPARSDDKGNLFE